MEFRKINNSDLHLSAITFGAWAIGGWMWGGTNRKEATEALLAAYDSGITSIDTAPVYGQGLSEEIVGEALKNIPREKVQILTKYGMRWDENKGALAMKSKSNSGKDIDIYKYAGRESIIKECEDSLKRLKTDYIDLYQIHWHDVITPIQESMETVSDLIKQGKVRYAGVCNYNTEQMAEAEKYVDLVSNQVPYSMVHRDIEKDVVPYCIQHHKSILAYSPLQRGILTGKIKPGHHFNEGDHRENMIYYKNENIEKINNFLQKINPIAEEKKATLAQVVIRWTLEQPGITIALVGARNASQAIQNAKAANVVLTKEEIDMITRELNQLSIQ